MTAGDVMGKVWTVRGVADYLKDKDRTICRLVANRDMPGFEPSAFRRFRKAEIDCWTDVNAPGAGGASEQ